MNSQTAYDRIAECAFMAGMRGSFVPTTAVEVAHVLVESGRINVFELTMNSPQAIEAMQAIKHIYGDNAVVGMGTVLDVEMARQVLDAGADFVVAPSFSRAVVEYVLQHDILVVPGVMTPTEAVDAWSTGVKLLKLFPSGPLGLDYFKALRGPLDHINFMCNGGTDDTNSFDFLKAGAVACGMAGWLTGNGSTPLDVIARRAKLLRDGVTALRTGIRV
ncbi:MAG: bifunctional 4-hydroxy-2-oxoglutarate aldolase/2-dehydro-3-deoxy-phosphogluconate aldolase [Anaerolineae bacterium]|nr:bifunctional 4-hydroxy-2-oxoglutarate aldolase/2-dehydro-3-deoxy-phosphogluconate aldolase [Anaerolineae bacterium]